MDYNAPRGESCSVIDCRKRYQPSSRTSLVWVPPKPAYDGGNILGCVGIRFNCFRLLNYLPRTLGTSRVQQIAASVPIAIWLEERNPKEGFPRGL